MTRRRHSFFREHSLSLVTASILTLWLVMYIRSDPSTHAGSFFGNAIADWSGTLVMVLATKYMYEVGSAESKKPRADHYSPLMHLLRTHSLTIFLAITGAFWLIAFLRMDPGSKWGQVTGNIFSEWLQTIGIVIMTKKLYERGSKESGSAPKKILNAPSHNQ